MLFYIKHLNIGEKIEGAQSIAQNATVSADKSTEVVGLMNSTNESINYLIEAVSHFKV